MSDSGKIELTRRKILASMGAVGAAGAGAGLGTSALFSDTEGFENNTIAAGTLDLKVDWEEHYSYPQLYGLGDPTEDRTVTRTEPEDTSNYTALPDPQNPVVWVHDDDFDGYFADTVIEAFPDAPGDPITANFTDSGSGNTEQPCEVLADVPQDLGAYNDEDLGRTRNDDTFDSDADGDGVRPLISLRDVKPGDYGELTLSTHLCYNDGYLWLSMPGGLAESENGLTDPEGEVDDTPDEGELADKIQTALWYDDNCSNTIDGDPDPLIAMALIDTSDSIDHGDMEDIEQASNAFVENLYQQSEAPIAAGVMTFNGADPGSNDPEFILRNDVERLEKGSAYLDSGTPPEGKFDAGDNPDDDTNLLPYEGDGDTPLAPALDLAREVLNDRAQQLMDNDPDFGSNTRKTILLISDGLPSGPTDKRYNLVDPNGDDVIANAGVTNEEDGQFASDVFDGITPSGTGLNVEDEAALVARDIDTGPREDNGGDYSADLNGDPISGSDGIDIRTVGIGTENDSDLNDFLTRIATIADYFYNPAGTGNLPGVISDIIMGLNVTGPAEEVIFRGTLDKLADELDPAEEGPLPLDGNRMTTAYDELGGDPTDGPEEGRECFNAAATHCFGFAWWVPTDVGNVIQGDSVEFDLAFLAEQCRNNDDPGQTVLSD